ncbi:hypothetical protein BJ138DRAFT_1002462 [Hygrophoropsis aurantiaca]|uniref:Uncharacterized protein n=1 Tax=Hygrophoropsis aurantiaca TaxID=72124 RepID=A0ACB8AJB6_9AGAM|nr:hypothetical protein BJ138DRAFT_1002462 [Hygrophoropsis aurantiaca]
MWSLKHWRTRTPINSLPNEIIAEIFVLGSTSHRETDAHERWASGMLFACCVASVNRHWREVALSIPIIWSTIIISDRKSLAFPALLIARSRNLPLDVVMYLGSDEENDMMVDTLLLLHDYISKVRSLILRVNFMTLSCAFFDGLFNIVAPALEHLDIEMMDENLNSWEEHVTQSALREFCAKGAHRLSSLHLRGDLLHTSPQWFTVTRLDLTLEPCLRPRAWNDFGDLLASCSTLKTLVLHGGSLPIPHADTPEVSILHSSLRSLAVDYCLKIMHRPTDIAHFLSHLKAPSLQYLELHCVTDIGINLLASEGHRDELALYPSLETLRIIEFVPQDGASSQSIHAVFPSIRELQTDQISADYILTSTTLSADHSTSTSLSTWPHLETLTCEGGNFTWLYDIIQSRQRDRCPLLRVRILDTRYSPNQLALLKNHVIVERLVDRDNGYIPISRLADIEDLPDLPDVWAELEGMLAVLHHSSPLLT